MKTLGDMHILVIGAGIAGLTTAALLNKEGVKVTILEKMPQREYNTSGYMIGFAAWRACS